MRRIAECSGDLCRQVNHDPIRTPSDRIKHSDFCLADRAAGDGLFPGLCDKRPSVMVVPQSERLGSMGAPVAADVDQEMCRAIRLG